MKRILLIWLPLLCAWLVLNLEEVIYLPLVAGFGDLKSNLAAFNIAYTFLLLCESFIYPVLSGSNVFSKNKYESDKFFGFVAVQIVLITAFVLVCSTRPVSNLIFSQIMGLNSEITELTRKTVLIFSLSPILIGYRRFFQGILISYGKSKVVTISSISRLIAIIITSFIASKFFSEGTLIASIGNVGGITIDALITRIACHKVLRLIPNNTTEEQNNKCPSVLLFYLPLGISATIIYISFPAINFFASFGAFPLESIATFGSIYCITFLLKSFGMSFQEIVISQWNKDVKTNADLRKTMFFVAGFSFVITLIFCFSDLLKTYYSSISGLSTELIEFSIVPTQILFLIPALTVFICYLKGIFIQEKRTNLIFVSSIIEIVSLILLLIIGISFKSYSAVEKSTVAVVLSNLIVLGYLILKSRQNKSI